MTSLSRALSIRLSLLGIVLPQRDRIDALIAEQASARA